MTAVPADGIVSVFPLHVTMAHSDNNKFMSTNEETKIFTDLIHEKLKNN